MPQPLPEQLKSVFAGWCDSFVAAFQMMTGEQLPPSWKPESVTPSASGLDWYAAELSISEGAGLWAGASTDAWAQLEGRVQTALGMSATEDAGSVIAEILSQAASGAASRIGQVLGQEISSAPVTGKSSQPPPSGSVTVSFEFDGGGTGPFFITISPALVAVVAPPSAIQQVAFQKEDTRPPVTFDLLLEVELPVSVSFGRAQLGLRDVLKLNSGSIIELNRTANEPVEVIVNNCVIARGEVVVVGGNYGVRIQHVVSRDERLRSLN